MPNEKENEMKELDPRIVLLRKLGWSTPEESEMLKSRLKAAQEVVMEACEFTSYSLYGSLSTPLAKAIDAYNDLEPHPSTINDPQLPTSITSGGCPAIVKDALNSISLSAEAVEKIRTGLTMALDGWSLSASDYEEKYYPMAGPQSLRDILKTALALLPHADTGKGME